MDREKHLRERAYQIWEDEGRVDGFHEEHWRRAEEEARIAGQQLSDTTNADQQSAVTEGAKSRKSAVGGHGPASGAS